MITSHLDCWTRPHMHPRGLPPAPSIHGFCTQLLGGSYTKNQTIIPQINTLQGHPGGPNAGAPGFDLWSRN